MNEQELERIAARLGERAAARLDVDATAAAVVARLRAPVRTAHWWDRPALLKMAATVALMVGGGAVAVKTLRHTAPAEASAPVVASLQTLSSDELEEVFDSLSIDAPSEGAPVGLHDLTSEQLRELLQRMEG